MRIAAVGDVHAGRTSTRELIARLHRIGEDADMLLLAGDLTDHGEPEQAVTLATQLASVSIPIVCVLGNHDYERGSPLAVVDALEHAGVRTLDGTSFVVGNVGVAGVKGFGGGFDPRQLSAFGERVLKDFVAEIDRETTKLAHALARLETQHKIVLLHYSPVIGTLEGEPREIYPFLGSSKLAIVAEKFGATMILHGHAHGGQFSSHTKNGIPVYNCAASVLRRLEPPRGYAVFDLD